VDVSRIHHDALVRIDGVTRTTAGACIRSRVLAPSNYIIMAAPTNTTTHGQELPIAVGQVVGTSCKRGTFVVAWILPLIARVDLCFARRTEKHIVDVFEPWVPMDGFAAQYLKQCLPPDTIVNMQSTNYDLADDQTLPYGVIDDLCVQDSIDLT